ncbi:hypothetical protein PIB30_083011 [Stylosanthes scabra]|uniref:Uncharacterized protein n=1 Tax=Stylosanthes scabra TaxID=79078 RepID=A0ABU6TRM9_9FABA|nr:hypothetical protein [Stylosanthes scabra]
MAQRPRAQHSGRGVARCTEAVCQTSPITWCRSVGCRSLRNLSSARSFPGDQPFFATPTIAYAEPATEPRLILGDSYRL